MHVELNINILLCVINCIINNDMCSHVFLFRFIAFYVYECLSAWDEWHCIYKQFSATLHKFWEGNLESLEKPQMLIIVEPLSSPYRSLILNFPCKVMLSKLNCLTKQKGQCFFPFCFCRTITQKLSLLITFVKVEI